MPSALEVIKHNAITKWMQLGREIYLGRWLEIIDGMDLGDLLQEANLHERSTWNV